MLGQIWYSPYSDSINLFFILLKCFSSLLFSFFSLRIMLTKLILHQKAEKVQKWKRENKIRLISPRSSFIGFFCLPSLGQCYYVQQSLAVRWSDCFSISVLYMSKAWFTRIISLLLSLSLCFSIQEKRSSWGLPGADGGARRLIRSLMSSNRSITDEDE